MRTSCLVLLGCALLFTGCGPGDQATALQSRVDSLLTVNQRLQNELANAANSVEPQERILEPAVYFPSGSAWLTASARQSIDSLAAVIQQQAAEQNFRIRGYTDSTPISASLQHVYPSNWYLSAQRAAAVAHYLDREHGIQSGTLQIGAFGTQEPAAPNETAEGRRQNRRVVVAIQVP